MLSRNKINSGFHEEVKGRGSKDHFQKVSLSLSHFDPFAECQNRILFISLFGQLDSHDPDSSLHWDKSSILVNNTIDAIVVHGQ